MELSCPLSPCCLACESPELSEDDFCKIPQPFLPWGFLYLQPTSVLLMSSWMQRITFLGTCTKSSMNSSCPRRRPFHVLQNLCIWLHLHAQCSRSICSPPEAQTATPSLAENLCPYLASSGSVILPQESITENIHIFFVRKLWS